MRGGNPILFFIGLFAGALLYSWLLKPSSDVRIVETVKTHTDTIYVTVRERVDVPVERIRERIDTVFISESFKAPVRRYSDTVTLEYGNIEWRAETAGELLNLSFIPRFDIPTVHTVTEKVRTETRTIHQRGIYAGAGVNSNLNYSVGASYVDKEWMFGYGYEPQTNIHSVGVKRRLF